MSFNWYDFIELGKSLIEIPGKFREAALRSAVSRAYYAGFNIASEHEKENHGYNPYNFDSHSQLKEHFRKKNVKISRHLDTLHQWRKQCDYDQEVNNLEKLMIPSVINKVDNMLSLLN